MLQSEDKPTDLSNFYHFHILGNSELLHVLGEFRSRFVRPRLEITPSSRASLGVRPKLTGPACSTCASMSAAALATACSLAAAPASSTSSCNVSWRTWWQSQLPVCGKTSRGGHSMPFALGIFRATENHCKAIQQVLLPMESQPPRENERSRFGKVHKQSTGSNKRIMHPVDPEWTCCAYMFGQTPARARPMTFRTVKCASVSPLLSAYLCLSDPTV